MTTSQAKTPPLLKKTSNKYLLWGLGILNALIMTFMAYAHFGDTTGGVLAWLAKERIPRARVHDQQSTYLYSKAQTATGKTDLSRGEMDREVLTEQKIKSSQEINQNDKLLGLIGGTVGVMILVFFISGAVAGWDRTFRFIGIVAGGIFILVLFLAVIYLFIKFIKWAWVS